MQRSAASKKRREDDSPRAVRLSDGEARASRNALSELGVSALDDEADEPMPFLDRMREASDHVKPTLSRLASALRSGWATMIASAGPRATALGAWLKKVIDAVKAQLGARLPVLMARLRTAPAKRRTTSPPPEAERERPTRTTGKRAEAAPELAKAEGPRFPLRYALAGLIGAVAIMFVMRALTPAAEEEAPVHEPTIALEPTPAIEEPPVAPEAAVEPTVVVASPASVAPVASTDEAPAAEVVLPGTLSPPSSTAGRLAAPTFPRVEEAPAAEATTTAESEETLPRPTGRLTFGAADVPHGRSTTLTMTLPIASLEGEATDSGFTVNLPGVNSLSRAAPIAAANPSVERAAILNSGDHAVLTVRFVPGRTPAYRIEARGSDLIVTIGR